MTRKVEKLMFCFAIFTILLLLEIIFDVWAAAPKKATKSKKAVAKKKPPAPKKVVKAVAKKVTKAKAAAKTAKKAVAKKAAKTKAAAKKVNKAVSKKVTKAMAKQATKAVAKKKPKSAKKSTLKITVINAWKYGPMDKCHKNFSQPKFPVKDCPKGEAVNAFMYMECRTCEKFGMKTILINCTHRIMRQTEGIQFFCNSEKKELCFGIFAARNVKRSYNEFCKQPVKAKGKAKSAPKAGKAKPKAKAAKKGRKRKRDLQHEAASFDLDPYDFENSYFESRIKPYNGIPRIYDERRFREKFLKNRQLVLTNLQNEHNKRETENSGDNFDENEIRGDMDF